MPKFGFDVEIRTVTDRDGRAFTLYGYTPGKTCKECNYLHYEQQGKTYPRCTLNNILQKKNFKTETQACIFFEERSK